MSGPTAAEVLDLWERGERLGPIERAVALAAAAPPPAGEADVAGLPLGRRDARLLRLRIDLGGPTLAALAACPSCGQPVEFAVDAAALLADEVPGDPSGRMAADGFALGWRSPDSRDLEAAAREGTAEGAERVLLERCITSAPEANGANLPGAARAAVAEAMAAADPLAEVVVDVRCPACATAFRADLDVAGFVWSEVQAHARRLLREVNVLARAYGWTEREVLALGDERRAAYLRLVGEVRP